MYSSDLTLAPPRTAYALGAAASLRHVLDPDHRPELTEANLQIHEAMLEHHGLRFDRERYDAVTSWTYRDAYAMLLDVAARHGRSPQLLVGGHVLPDLLLDDAPAVRMVERFPSLVAAYSLADAESMTPFHVLSAAQVSAQTLESESVAVLLVDRCGYSTAEEPAAPDGCIPPAGDHGILLVLDRCEGSGLEEMLWRSGADDPHWTATLAEEITTAAGPHDVLIVTPELAPDWCPEGAVVAPAGYPATALWQAALAQPVGSVVLMVAHHRGLGQLGALRVTVPEVLL